MKLSGFDLNHVRALHQLIEEAHVARAARRLAITPAAASNALRRLRRDFGDPLLIRNGRTLVRSALAEELRGPAAEVMAAAERLVCAAVAFDPATDAGMFVLLATDRIANVLGPPLDRALAARAPRANLHFKAFTAGPGAPGADRGLLIGPGAPTGLLSEPLFTEAYVSVLRVGHPLLEGTLTIQRFADAEHILVAPRGDSTRGAVDDALAAHGLSRRVSRVVTSFELALALAEESDRIVTLPSSFVAGRSAAGSYVTRTPPVEIAPIRMQVSWHPRQEGDPRYMWFRGLLHDVVHECGLSPGAPTVQVR